MADREKVIGLLHETAEYFRGCRNNASFASKAENHFWELQNAANEAVELLKEQEPVKPDSFMDGRVQRFACKKCGKHLLYAEWGRDNYCSKCGQAVKWDD